MLTIETGTENKILRTHCEPVTKFDDGLKSLIQEMEATMTAPDPETGIKGVGLAANQVGKNLRLLLMTLNVNTNKDHKIVAMINPEILELSKEKIEMEEGCLSLPGKFFKLSRPAKVKVRWQNEEGNWCEKKFEKWDARIFLHEYDHLEGILFTDYLKEEPEKVVL